MKAIKANKEYTIDEDQKKHYQEAGYDIYDDDGSLVEYGRGKTVPMEEYIAVVKKSERLQEENKLLRETVENSGKAAKETGKAGTKKAGE